jgi:hypothetical protein
MKSTQGIIVRIPAKAATHSGSTWPAIAVQFGKRVTTVRLREILSTHTDLARCINELVRGQCRTMC